MAGSPNSFVGSFYDLETATRFCVHSNAMAAEAHTKTGKEVHCLERLVRRYSWEDHLGNHAVNLIDLGTGSGYKAVRIIDALMSAGVRSVSFFPVDTSPYCASFAILTALTARQNLTDEVLRNLFERPPTTVHGKLPQSLRTRHSDLAGYMAAQESGTPMVSCGDLTVLSRGVSANFMRDTPGVMRMIRDSPAYVDGVNVFTLLGQTIGNYSPTERHSFLSELFSKMNGGDLLLVDAGVRPEEGESVDLDKRLRNLELAYFQEAGKFMRHKADHRSSRFLVAYVQSLHQMSHWFERPDGSAQFLGYSYLFTRGELIGSLIDIGYRVTRNVVSLDDAGLHPGPECMVVLAEKPASEIGFR